VWVNERVYRWTNRVVWPSLAVTAVAVALLYLDAVATGIERPVAAAGYAAAILFVVVAVQLLALSSRDAARFMLRLLGDDTA